MARKGPLSVRCILGDFSRIFTQKAAFMLSMGVLMRCLRYPRAKLTVAPTTSPLAAASADISAPGGSSRPRGRGRSQCQWGSATSTACEWSPQERLERA
eukprot:CAMPEP_0115199300 /NCGR_PEP_ID=MMETSP0270-20121206/16548_1 /TAXON_ID=71861 /ORGANISM="Scrippsiella trochoidea, Strain CCMP3099" /LENGTH=98 /DNA_ID=CAMNT_0002612695 /DNA_START=137 /DNA_END=430 /DNA_ORIENTATION=-